PDLPFFNQDNFIQHLKHIIKEYKIDAVYPAMDAVITFLKDKEGDLGCKVIASDKVTTEICLSKLKTYHTLEEEINTPKIFDSIEEVSKFPVFLKPNIGYGSRGAKKVNNLEEGRMHLDSFPDSLILEFLPGKEYTVDCFTDRHGKLLYYGARERRR